MRVVIPLLLFVTTGCASLPGGREFSWPWSKSEETIESKYAVPARMAALWTTDALAAPGQTPTRGFGGRLYFYDDRSRAVPVEGQLIVFAYDETATDGRPRAQQIPDRKFVFTPEQFTQHFSETELGASYSVWLPWDAVGGEQRRVALLPVFTSPNGHVVMGQQTMTVLPGRAPEPANAASRQVGPPQAGSLSAATNAPQNVSQERYPVRPVSYGPELNDPRVSVASGELASLAPARGPHGAPPAARPNEVPDANDAEGPPSYEPSASPSPKVRTAESSDRSRRKMRTTTIAVPPTMTRRLMNAPTAEDEGSDRLVHRASRLPPTAAQLPMPTAPSLPQIQPPQPPTAPNLRPVLPPTITGPAPPADPRSAHFSPPRFPAPNRLIERSSHDRARWQPGPATPPSFPPSPPSPWPNPY